MTFNAHSLSIYYYCYFVLFLQFCRFIFSSAFFPVSLELFFLLTKGKKISPIKVREWSVRKKVETENIVVKNMHRTEMKERSTGRNYYVLNESSATKISGRNESGISPFKYSMKTLFSYSVKDNEPRFILSNSFSLFLGVSASASASVSVLHLRNCIRKWLLLFKFELTVCKQWGIAVLTWQTRGERAQRKNVTKWEK